MQKPQRPPRLVRPNSLRAWWLAARPKTLSAALMPIVAASAFAFTKDSFNWQPALLCILFATLMQIAANFINDLPFAFRRLAFNSDRISLRLVCFSLYDAAELLRFWRCVGLCFLWFRTSLLHLLCRGRRCLTGNLLIRRRMRTGHRYAARLKQLSRSNNGSRSRQTYADRHFRGAFWQFVLSRSRPHRLRLHQWCFCFQRPLVSPTTAALYSLPHRYVARNGSDQSRPSAE